MKAILTASSLNECWFLAGQWLSLRKVCFALRIPSLLLSPPELPLVSCCSLGKKPALWVWPSFQRVPWFLAKLQDWVQVLPGISMLCLAIFPCSGQGIWRFKEAVLNYWSLFIGRVAMPDLLKVSLIFKSISLSLQVQPGGNLCPNVLVISVNQRCPFQNSPGPFYYFPEVIFIILPSCSTVLATISLQFKLMNH